MPVLRFLGFLLFVLALLADCSPSPELLESSYRAGSAKIKITPKGRYWLAGYGHRESEVVSEDLWVRVLALEDANGNRGVLVALDVECIPPSMSQSIHKEAYQKLGLNESQLILFSSHSHNSAILPSPPDPVTFYKITQEELSEVDDYAKRVQKSVIDGATQALHNLFPVSLSYGRGKATFAMYRRGMRENGDYGFMENPDGPTDRDVPALVVRSHDGSVKAVAFTYACHATTAAKDNPLRMKFHPGYPGVAAKIIEMEYPGATALFITGCGGDINPHPRGGLTEVNHHGAELAEAVISVVKRAPESAATPRLIEGPLQTRFQRVDLPLKNLSREELETQLSLPPKESKLKSFTRLNAESSLRMIKEGTLPTKISFPIHVWKFGKDLNFIALAGETTVDYVIRLKKELGVSETWVAGYADEILCYIPSERVLREGGYEAGWSPSTGPNIAMSQMAAFEWPSPFASGVEELIISTVHHLIERN